jgi:hypothetical protein
MFYDLRPLSCDGLMFHGFFDERPVDGRQDALAEVKAIIVAYAHEFCFDYEFALHLMRTRVSVGCSPLPTLTRLEFLELLEFREDEIRRVISGGDTSWCWPPEWSPTWNNALSSCLGSDLDEALRQTQQAQAVQKTLLGHGSRIAPDETVNMRIGRLMGIFMAYPDFAVALDPPLLLSSYDRPPPTTAERYWDFDDVLGTYHKPGAIFLYERALTHCSEAIGVQRRLLRVIVILHEISHYLAYGPPAWCHSNGSHWDNTGYTKTSKDVHETIAQLLTYWTTFPDSWLSETFERLNHHQSYAYRRFKEDLQAGADTRCVLAAIVKMRQMDTGASLHDWKDALGVYSKQPKAQQAAP